MRTYTPATLSAFTPTPDSIDLRMKDSSKDPNGSRVAPPPKWIPHPDVPEVFRTMLSQVANHIPSNYQQIPHVGEEFDSKDALKERVQGYAFFGGFAVIAVDRKDKHRFLHLVYTGDSC